MTMNLVDLPTSPLLPQTSDQVQCFSEGERRNERHANVPLPHSIDDQPAQSLSGQAYQIWRDIRNHAREIAEREPLLVRRLQHLILEREAGDDMLAAILSHQLATAVDIDENDLHVLMATVLRECPSILAQATADMKAVKTRDPSCVSHFHVLLNLKGFQALQTHRVSHQLWRQGRQELAFTLANKASLVFGVDIHPAACIGASVMLDHGVGIVIGETAVIEDNVSILQNVTLGGTGKEHGNRHPKIRSGVMIGAGAKVLGNIEVGTMSRVAAGSVVLKDVPPHVTVAGVPAKIVRQNVENNFPAIEMRQSI